MGSQRPDAPAEMMFFAPSSQWPSYRYHVLTVSAVLMSGYGGSIGGQIMPRVQLPAVTPKGKTWNKGRIIGQKRPLLPKQVWAIRAAALAEWRQLLSV